MCAVPGGRPGPSTDVDASPADGERLGVLPLLLLFAGAAAYAFVVPSQGIPWDEYFQRLIGQGTLAWYRTGFADTSLFDVGNLFLYGGTVEAPLEAAAAALPADPHLVRHALVAGFALAAAWGTLRLGTLVDGRTVGIVAMLLLLTHPRFFGHGSFNSKDIPTATFYLWTLVLVARDLRRPVGSPLWHALPAGVLLGLLLGTRTGAGIILPALLVGYGLWAVRRAGRAGLVRGTARFSFVFLVGWGVMLVGWPWGLQRPLTNPITALLVSGRFPWGYDELFAGRFVSSLDVPVGYVPTWLAATLPEVLLAGLAAAVLFGAIRLVVDRKTPAPIPSMVVLALTVPPTYVVVTGAALYDGVRHLLFVQPLFALAAAWGIVQALRALGRWRPAAAGVAAVLVGSGILLSAADMVRLSPYQHVYFNRLGGGLEGAEGRYELDYWGLTYREGVERLVERVPERGVRLASCSHPESTRPFAEPHFDYVGSFGFGLGGRPEYLLLTARHDCHLGRPPPGDPLEEVRADPLVTRLGVPLLRVVRDPPIGAGAGGG